MRGIRSIFRDQKKVLRFLTSRTTLLFFLFLLISLAFWFVQILQDTYVTTLRVPVVLNEVPSDIAISEEVPEYIEVEVRDNGFALLNYNISQVITPIYLNFTPDQSREGYMEWGSAEIENELFKRFGANGRRTRIVTFFPSRIAFSYSPKAKREVPIDFKAQIVPAPGVVIKDFVITPENVIVYGQKSDIDTLTVIRTDTTTFLDLRESISLKIPLVAPEGMTLTPSVVTASVTIEPLLQRTFSIPVTVNYTSSRYTLRVFPTTVKVTCVVQASKAHELLPMDIEVTLEEGDIQNDHKGKLRLKISKYPDFVQMIQCDPDEVEYILEEK